MNYIKQLNEFYSTLDYKPLTANAIAVYTILLQIANKAGWIDKFRVANTVLMSKCNLDMQKLIRARSVLINQGYIEYFKGKNQTEAPTYRISKLYDIANNIANDIANNIADDIADNIADNIANNNPNDNINKQNKTKQNYKKKIEKKSFSPPSLDDIKNYVKDKDLNVDAEYFYKYFSEGNWIDSKGNKVKNWKQKLITWDSHSNSEKPKNELKNFEHEITYTEKDFTPEQYVRLSKGQMSKEEMIKILEAKDV